MGYFLIDLTEKTQEGRERVFIKMLCNLPSALHNTYNIILVISMPPIHSERILSSKSGYLTLINFFKDIYFIVYREKKEKG